MGTNLLQLLYLRLTQPGAAYAKSSSMSFLHFISFKSKNPEIAMRAFKLIAMSILAAGSLLADELKPPSTNAAANVPTTDVLLREIHYDGKLSDSDAKYA